MNRVMGLRLLIALLVIGIWSGSVNCATIEQMRAPGGRFLHALKVEGNIEPGDATKLLTTFIETMWTTDIVRYVSLMSKGGDVEEAMKMGTMIRRLRLGTEAPWLARVSDFAG